MVLYYLIYLDLNYLNYIINCFKLLKNIIEIEFSCVKFNKKDFIQLIYHFTNLKNIERIDFVSINIYLECYLDDYCFFLLSNSFQYFKKIKYLTISSIIFYLDGSYNSKCFKYLLCKYYDILSLKELNFTDLNIQNGFNYILNTIMNLTNLRKLTLSNINLIDIDIKNLTLCHLSFLEDLIISRNYISEKCLNQFSLFYSQNDCLKSLDLSYNKLYSKINNKNESNKDLYNVLSLKSLTHLNLQNNRLQEYGLNKIYESNFNNTCLEYLNLSCIKKYIIRY